jgi:hypothetical protein
MNNLGKDKIALKIANVVTKILLKQEEIISLCWKNEYKVSVSDSSNKDNAILQEDSKASPSERANVEALTDDAAQEDPIYKKPRTSKRQNKPPIKGGDFFCGK